MVPTPHTQDVGTITHDQDTRTQLCMACLCILDNSISSKMIVIWLHTRKKVKQLINFFEHESFMTQYV